jgi:hypothetical protein
LRGELEDHQNIANAATKISATGHGLLQDSSNFSVVLGGPLFQLLRRAHLSNDALTLLWRRIIVITTLAWLPLLLFSILDGDAVGHSVNIPFLFDVEAQLRFLVAMPLLIGAELAVHRRMLGAARQFPASNLVSENATAQFDQTVASAIRLRNSVLAELLLIGLVYGVGILIIWRHYIALDTATWYATPTAEGNALRLAGIWYGYVSLPIFQFLLFRWYFRLFVWARFLWQVSRIPLNLIPTHPDHMAGLGFLSAMVLAITFLAPPHGVVVAGMIANRIFYVGASLPTFADEIAVIVVFVMIVLIGPVLLFVPQLARAKQVGNLEYGMLADRYVREFDRK